MKNMKLKIYGCVALMSVCLCFCALLFVWSPGTKTENDYSDVPEDTMYYISVKITELNSGYFGRTRDLREVYLLTEYLSSLIAMSPEKEEPVIPGDDCYIITVGTKYGHYLEYYIDHNSLIFPFSNRQMVLGDEQMRQLKTFLQIPV